jgi:ABC-2 type transport system ATP-binding protein
VSVRTPQARLLMTALARAGARPERAGPDSLRVTGMTAAEISRIARGQHIDLHELAASRTGLEQVFRTLTAGPAAEQRPSPGAGEPP